jgi:hypothetical protein
MCNCERIDGFRVHLFDREIVSRNRVYVNAACSRLKGYPTIEVVQHCQSRMDSTVAAERRVRSKGFIVIVPSQASASNAPRRCRQATARLEDVVFRTHHRWQPPLGAMKVRITEKTVDARHCVKGDVYLDKRIVAVLAIHRALKRTDPDL